MLNYPIHPVDIYFAPVVSLFWKEGGPPRYSVGGKGKAGGARGFSGMWSVNPHLEYGWLSFPS